MAHTTTIKSFKCAGLTCTTKTLLATTEEAIAAGWRKIAHGDLCFYWGHTVWICPSCVEDSRKHLEEQLAEWKQNAQREHERRMYDMRLAYQYRLQDEQEAHDARMERIQRKYAKQMRELDEPEQEGTPCPAIESDEPEG